MEEDKNDPSDFVRFGVSIGESDTVFVRSCPEFEPKRFGLLRKLYQKPVVPIGFLPPLIEEEVEEDDDDDDDMTWVNIKEWLDEQRVNSVVYVSLGTEATLTREELGKLALGLEKSMLPFVWALRDEQDRAKSDPDMLPEGFKERVKGRGKIHVGWIPQIKILSHGSVGGFLTHCGWNSLIEGLGFGRVPIIFPVLNEQGLNARLLHEKKLGVEIPRDETDGSFDSDSVADSVRLAMVDEKGEAMRARAKEAKGSFGSRDKSTRYMDELVRYLKREEDSSSSY